MKNRKRQSREIEEEDVYVADILDGEAETPLERWRRDTSPLLSTDHRIAWLCGNPSKLHQHFNCHLSIKSCLKFATD